MDTSNFYKIVINILSNRLFLNITFWTIYAIFPLWLNWDTFGSDGNRNTDILWYLQAAVLVYTNNLILMPLLFDKRKYVRYFFAVVVMVCLGEYLSMFHITPLISNYLDYVSNKLLGYLYDLGDAFFIVLTFAGGRLIRQYILQQQNLEQLQKKQTETELAFLKSQVNPHLLFNTLNMIYSHSLEQSPKVSDMILSLSQNMRYMLYECNEAYVSLVKEIQFLQDYIDLQKMRIEDRGSVSFEVVGNAAGLQIAPMLLIGFIENAFKHASKNTINGIEIGIRIQIQAESLLLEVKNNYEKELIENELEREGGIGLENVRKRLELAYP
ncbi:MAG: sensor histidine kinase, partial [Bacteroidota bacterium]